MLSLLHLSLRARVRRAKKVLAGQPDSAHPVTLYRLLVVLLLSLASSQMLVAQIITTYAGGGTAVTGDGGPATEARLSLTPKAAIDKQGNLYFVNTSTTTIRRVDKASGTISTYPSANVTFNGPSELTFDSQDNLFIVTANSIVRVDRLTGSRTSYSSIGTGTVVTSLLFDAQDNLMTSVSARVFRGDKSNPRFSMPIVGTGTPGFAGDGGLATQAQIRNIADMVFDSQGNLFLADVDNNRIRRVDASTGIISTYAGGGTNNAQVKGPATAAALSTPVGLAFDGMGNLYISEMGGNRVRRVDASTGIITNYAGLVTGDGGFSGDGGFAQAAMLSRPGDLNFDQDGNLYIVDLNNSRIRRADTTPIPPNPVSITFTTSVSICQGITQVAIPYSALSGNPTSYTVTGDGLYGEGNLSGQTGTLTASLVKGFAGGPFTVLVSGPKGELSDPAPGQLVVIPIPQLSVQMPPPICTSQRLNLTNFVTSSTAGATFAFYRDAATSQPLTDPSSVSASGTYYVRASSQGCSSASRPISVTVNPAPTISISPSATAICAGQTVTLTASGSTAGEVLSYQWSSPDGTPIQTTATISVSVAGTYSVTATNGNGCSGTATVTIGSATPGPDYQPLADLYTSTNGANWTNKTNWLTNCDVCSWQGITCTNGRVTGIDLTSNNLSGTLPASLSGLTSLQSLLLGTNQLTGAIPASLGSLPALQTLILFQNSLTGSIPASLGSRTTLQVLNLSGNQLSGTVPDQLGGLTQLRVLNLSNNSLTGTLPTSLSALTGVQAFDLSRNQLTGSIPAGYGSLQNTILLNINNNQLSGCFPTSLSALCSYGTVVESLPTPPGYRSQARVAANGTNDKVNVTNNAGLPGGGDFDSFCAYGTGSCNNPPIVANAIPNQTATVGQAFSYTLPANTFTDPEGQAITVSVTGLPGGLTYSNSVISGTVSATAGSPVSVTVTATDAGGASANTVFVLVIKAAAPVNTVPVATANATQTATVGVAFTYTVNAFTDAETPNSLIYTGALSPANGLTFNPTTRVISGTATAAGPISVTVTATDPGGLSASTSFTIAVQPAPVVVTPLALTLTASPTTLLTTGTTTLSVTVSGGTPAYRYTFSGPGTITPNGNTASVSNLPAGVQTFTVVVSDATTPTSQTITKTVSVTVTAPAPVNTAPVATANASQTATVGVAFTYTVNAFTDAQTPNSLTYSASLNPANGLTFNPTTRVISGMPTASGFTQVNITATDPGGLSASTSFTIAVQPAPVVVTPLALTLSASPTTLLTTGTTTLSVTVSGGTPAYRYTFSGPGTITPNGNIASVSNLPAGVQTFTVVVSDATTPTNQTITKTVSVTVNAPATITALRVLHQDADNNLTNNAIKPTLQVVNEGTVPVDYGQLTLRYWLTVEQFAPLTNLSVYYAQLGTAKVKMKYVALDKPRQGAFGYVEYSFDGSAGSLAAGTNSGPIQTGIAKQDYTAFNEADDYSFANNRNLTANSRITAYVNGQLVWGTEPAEVAAQRTVKAYTENKNGASTNTISTFLQVRNEGNVAVSYSDLKVRYYFTSEGSQPLNFYLDYAVLGNQKVKGQFLRLNPALANADAYLELSFDGSLGAFNPGSSTGNIQYRIAKQDWSNFTQSNDYSYQNGTSPLAENSRVVIYLAGQRVWGTEPGTSGRLAAEEEALPLLVRVLGNPVVGATLDLEVRGAEGQPVQLTLTDLQGRTVSERSLERAGTIETQTLPVGNQPAGMLLLRVSTPSQTHTVKVLKSN